MQSFELWMCPCWNWSHLVQRQKWVRVKNAANTERCDFVYTLVVFWPVWKASSALECLVDENYSLWSKTTGFSSVDFEQPMVYLKQLLIFQIKISHTLHTCLHKFPDYNISVVKRVSIDCREQFWNSYKCRRKWRSWLPSPRAAIISRWNLQHPSFPVQTAASMVGGVSCLW